MELEKQEGEQAVYFDWRNTFAKWFIDCMTAGAVLNTLAFLIVMGVLKGHESNVIMVAIRKVSILTTT